MKIYVSGPMRGRDKYNYPAFETATKNLRALGHSVLSPHELDKGFKINYNSSLEEANTKLKYLAKASLDALQACDAIALIPGWAISIGANAEYHVAVWLGLKIITLDDNGDICK